MWVIFFPEKTENLWREFAQHMMDGVTAALEPMHIILPRLSEGKHGLQIFTNDQWMIHLSHVINLTFGSFESLTTRSRRLFSLSLPFEMCLVKKKKKSVYKPTNKKNTILSSYELSHLCVSSTMGHCKGTILILKLILTVWLVQMLSLMITRALQLLFDICRSDWTRAEWSLLLTSSVRGLGTKNPQSFCHVRRKELMIIHK